MKWKDHPNLFANGKFKIRFYSNYHKEFMQTILGCANLGSVVDEKSTLIARRLKDMTDAEKKEAERMVDEVAIPFALKCISEDTPPFTQDASVLMYLLSIGAYPFDQSVFDTGEVIDIKTINEKG